MKVIYLLLVIFNSASLFSAEEKTELPWFLEKIRSELFERGWMINQFDAFYTDPWKLSETSEFLVAITVAYDAKNKDYWTNDFEQLRLIEDTLIRLELSEPEKGKTWKQIGLDVQKVRSLLNQFDFFTEDQYWGVLITLEKNHWFDARSFLEIYPRADGHRILDYLSDIAHARSFISDEDYHMIFTTVKDIKEMDESTRNHLLLTITSERCDLEDEIPNKKEENTLKKVWENLQKLNLTKNCKDSVQESTTTISPESLYQPLLNEINSKLHLFVDEPTGEILQNLSTFEFEMERVSDILAVGCGDSQLNFNISSVLTKFVEIDKSNSNFVKVIRKIKINNTHENEENISNDDFQLALSIFQSFEKLTDDVQKELLEYMKENRLYRPLTFLQKMRTSGKFSTASLVPILNEVKSCTKKKLADVLLIVRAWRKGVDTREAINRLTSLYESSNCEMLKEVSLDRQKKSIEKIVGILEESFGFVSCENKKVEDNVKVNKTSEAVGEFLEGLNNSSLVSDDWIFSALNNTSEELLKTSTKLSEGCLNLMKLPGTSFEIIAILNKMPDPKLLQVLNSNRSWPELSKLSQSALNLLHKFEDLKVAEQEQLVQHHPMLQQLSDARHSLLDLTSCATRLAACGRLEEFLEVLSIWRLASEEARTRVLRLLEVSSCEVVDQLANGGEQVDKLVGLLDKYFGTKSCLMEEEDDLTRRMKFFIDFK